MISKIVSETDMLKISAQLAENMSKGILIFLEGDLGAGKTTFTRGFLRQFAYNGPVKSPTFTLVENYTINYKNLVKQTIYHFDLYRISDPEELDYMGISDYLDGEAIVLIEWPKKGHGFLPIADLVINIEYHGKQRLLSIDSYTEQGQQIIQKLI